MAIKLPEALIQSLKVVAGFEETSFREVHRSGEQVTSLRYNPAKLSDKNFNRFTGEESAQDLIQHSFLQPIPWCPDGYYLASRPSFTLDPLLHGGVYYVQEASSMFLWEILRQLFGEESGRVKVLDLCAAPGGKSTLLASFFKNGLLVANEVIRQRAGILSENLTKWGNSQVVVTSNDPKDFSAITEYFDLIVVDAPCSGSGLFRKDPEAVEEWSPENVIHCNQRQQRILADCYPALKKEGILIYATCSYSVEEDESIINHLTEAFGLQSLSLDLPAEWQITKTFSQNGSAGYRFFPDKVKGEGFFVAAFKKMTSSGESLPKEKGKINEISRQESAALQKWINQPEAYYFFKHQEKIQAVPQYLREEIAFLQKHLYLRKAGIDVGSLKGGELIPEHGLAMSKLLHPDIPAWEMDRSAAIGYLKKKEIQRATAMTGGWMLVTYLEVPLGWVKVLPNRVNNYYPANWRILKD